jgi:hypothetical protein
MQQMVTCPNCGVQSAGHQFCTSCGTRLPSAVQQQVWQAQPAPGDQAVVKEAAPPRRYVLLGVAAIIFRIIGWVVLVGGIIGSIAVAVLAAQGAMEGLKNLLDRGVGILGMEGVTGIGLAVFVFGGVIGSLLCGLGLLAFADLCSAVIAIDEHTR